jgi:hypothetical protein
MMPRVRSWRLLVWILARDLWARRKRAEIEAIVQGVIYLGTMIGDGIVSIVISIAIVVEDIDTTETQTENIDIVITANIANTGVIDLDLAPFQGLQDPNVAIEDQWQIVVMSLVVPGVLGQVLRDVIVILKVVEMHTIGIIVDRRGLPVLFLLELCMATAFCFRPVMMIEMI